MTTIVHQGPTGDGYDVRILSGGATYTLHFAAQPDATSLADAIAAFETRLMASAIDEQEEGHDELFDQ